MKKISYAFILLISTHPVHAGLFDWFAADNFYECILDDMPGEANPRRITEIYQDCKKQHPITEPVHKQRPFFGPHNISECLLRYGSDYQQAGIIWIREACRQLYYP